MRFNSIPIRPTYRRRRAMNEITIGLVEKPDGIVQHHVHYELVHAAQPIPVFGELLSSLP